MKNWQDGKPDKKLFHERMGDLITFLEKRVDISKLDALEVFGRTGDWHTTVYANKIKSLQVWEIDKKWKHPISKRCIKKLIFSLPNRDITSIKQI